MMRTLALAILLLLFIVETKAQQTFPVNGAHDVKPRYEAFIHATIVIDPQTTLNDATLIIKNGKVVSVSSSVPNDKELMIHDLKGKWIYPAFIDLYSNYGIDLPGKKTDKAGQLFISSKKGAYAWNEAVKAEEHAASLFSYDEKMAAQLRESGFGLVVSGLHDGIFRGSATLVSTGTGRENELIVKPRIASGMSFQKGSSKQDYPSSLMGSIALIRQTGYDAKWYQTQKDEINLTLESINAMWDLPIIFSVENKLNALRADQIAKEFNVSFIIKGNGDEYQRINEIRATRSPLILPVNFPKPYDVDDPNDADQISTTDLMHWELAPFNAGIVANYQIPFAITSNGCETAKMFLHNLRKAVSKGLDEKVALQALTTSPARFMKIESQTGSLKNGMLANFIIADGNLFKTESRVLELWTLGKRHVANEPEEPSIEGVFDIKSASLKGYSLSHSNGAKNTLLYSGDDTLKLHLKREKSYYLLQPKLPKSTDKIVNLIAWADETDSSVFPYRVNVIKGNITLPDGATEIFTATLSKPVTRSEKKDSISQDSLPSILYPFTDYGKPTDTQAETIVFKNATLWTNEGDGIVSESDLAIKDGKIIAIGKNLKIVSAKEIDATGRHLTSGIIDEHSHIAINNGVNENAQAVTSEVRVGDVINSEDLNIYRQLAGGVTASQLLHGSANPIGGQSALVKLRWGASPEQMKIEGADGFIKFALGENVKQSNWGDRATTRYPQTRMGVEQVLMDAFTRANEYSSAWRKNPRIRRDLELDALVEVLTKKRFITCHSYVQSEINLLMHIADSFGFKVNTFTHILEGYKVADKIKSHGANASTFADWWAYKMEVVDAIPYNASIMHKMGINTAINSDDAEMGRRLNQEAAKIVKYGNVNEEDAWKMVTLNPAKMLHLDKRMGSLAVGKDADIVLWSEHPLSIYAKPEYTFVDGRCLYSIEQDKKLREANNKIRQRIILKMIAAKRKGEPSEKYVSVPEEIYHCKD